MGIKSFLLCIYKINNEYSAYTNVIDKPNVLIINGVRGDSQALEEILNNGIIKINKNKYVK